MLENSQKKEHILPLAALNTNTLVDAEYDAIIPRLQRACIVALDFPRIVEVALGNRHLVLEHVPRHVFGARRHRE